MDQINGWPKQLPCLCAMTGSCREQFRHFVLMSEVSSAVVSCKPALNYTHSSYLFLFMLHSHCFFSQLSVHITFPFFCTPFEHTFVYYHFWFSPALSKSDPFVGNYCIFNPDLDNGTVTVIFLLLGYLLLWGCSCHSHFVSSPLPIIATLTNSEECYDWNNVHAVLYLQLQILISFLWTFFFFHKHSSVLICP